MSVASDPPAIRHNVRPLLPGPDSVVREAVLHMGAGPESLLQITAHASSEALVVDGLSPDQLRVIERELNSLGGVVVSSRSGDSAVLLGSLRAIGELPAALVAWGHATADLGKAIGSVLLGRTFPAPVRAGRYTLPFGTKTLVMGIINATPDSFSGDGVDRDIAAAVQQAELMAAAGACALDVGGESTRPHGTPVSEAEELARVIPVIKALSTVVDLPISIDTKKANVARAAIDAGASIVNDIWGLLGDPEMAGVVADSDAALIVMHNQRGTDYLDVVAEICQSLRRSLAAADAVGIDSSRVIIDPGFGFGKTPAHNIELIQRLRELTGLGRPILIGPSRKSTIGALLDGAPPEDRLHGSIALAVLAAARGAHIVRVHDVEETVRALTVADAVIHGMPDSLRSLPAPGVTG